MIGTFEEFGNFEDVANKMGTANYKLPIFFVKHITYHPPTSRVAFPNLSGLAAYGGNRGLFCVRSRRMSGAVSACPSHGPIANRPRPGSWPWPTGWGSLLQSLGAASFVD